MRETEHDAASFSAGMRCGTRVAACIARAAALELLTRGRWWNRRRYRLMARTLVACAEELESEAEAVGRGREERSGPDPATARAAAPGPGARSVERVLDS